ncbi:MAG: hypothetical protein ACRC14_04690 [Paracoccaceae bacterium]
MKPKEDPADKAARLRERRVSELEQGRTAEQTAGGLSSDLRSVYKFKNLPNMFTPGISGLSAIRTMAGSATQPRRSGSDR